MKQVSHNGFAGDAEKIVENGRPFRSGSDYLRLLGESIRSARTRRGLTRKQLAQGSGVSERFLAQLESGAGNASVLVLRQIAHALGVPLESIFPNGDQHRTEFAATVELLRQLAPADLAKVNEVLQQRFGVPRPQERTDRIALIGLRGAGKSTIGKLLGQKLKRPFFELDRLIEHESGLSLSAIFDMYGQSGFRRWERRCLEDLLKREEKFVVATGGSIVSEPNTYDLLLSSCFTIWLRATPEEHMSRVIAQGDIRPMAQNPEAMSDLKRILLERELLYGKADASVDTSGRTVQELVEACLYALTIATASV